MGVLAESPRLATVEGPGHSYFVSNPRVLDMQSSMYLSLAASGFASLSLRQRRCTRSIKNKDTYHYLFLPDARKLCIVKKIIKVTA